jgi:hypothetical protein
MVRAYRSQDFNWLDEWSVFHEGRRMLPTMIPQVGFISEDDSGPAAYWGVARTDTIFAMGMFLVTRPGLKREDRKEHVKNVILAAKEWAKKMNVSLFCLSEKPSVKLHLEASGFSTYGDSFGFHYIGG